MADIFEQLLSQAAPRGDYGNMFAVDPVTRGRLMAEAEMKSQRAESRLQEQQPLNLENIRAQIAMHQAQTGQYNAMAEKYHNDARIDNTMRYADKMAKQKQADDLNANRIASASLEGALNIPQVNDPTQEFDPRTEALRAMSSTMPEQVRRMLEPSAGVSNYTNENVRSIIQRLREQDPNASKANIAEINARSVADRVDTQTASAERIAAMKAQALKDVQSAKPAKGESIDQMTARILKEKLDSGALTPAAAVDYLLEAKIAGKPQQGMVIGFGENGKIGPQKPKEKPKLIDLPKNTQSPEEKKLTAEERAAIVKHLTTGK